MKVSPFLLSALLLLGAGCEQAQKVKESYDTFSQLNEASKAVTAEMDEAQSQHDERIQRGDTVSLPYKDLQQYLPAAPSGYLAENPGGESMKAGGIAFSTASQEFRKGEARLNVSLTDYNGAQDMYQGMAAMFALGLEKENEEELVRPSQLNIDGVKGMETFHKTDGRAELLLTVGGRFLIKIEADEQKDLDFVQNVAREMSLKKWRRCSCMSR